MSHFSSLYTEMASKLMGVLNSGNGLEINGCPEFRCRQFCLEQRAAKSIFLLRPDLQVAQHMVPAVDDEIMDRVPVVAVLVPAV